MSTDMTPKKRGLTPDDIRRCTAKNRSGEQCGRAKMLRPDGGGYEKKCNFHGGKVAAKLRGKPAAQNVKHGVFSKYIPASEAKDFYELVDLIDRDNGRALVTGGM